MRIGAQLESGTAGEGRVVKNGQRKSFSDVRKSLLNLPYKSQWQENLAEIQKRSYYPRHLSRCKGRVRDQKEVQIKLVIDRINCLKYHVVV
jgi:hypothetical protein